MNVRLIDERISRALSRIRLPFRARIIRVKADAPTALMQLEGLEGEPLNATELFQQFGFASVPPEGWAIVLPLGGKTGRAIVIGTEAPKHRPRDLKKGESILYSAFGDYVKVCEGRIIEIKAAQEVLIDAPKATVLHDLHVVGNISCDGNISDSVGTLAQVRSIYNSHDHALDSDGTATPRQPMGGA